MHKFNLSHVVKPKVILNNILYKCNMKPLEHDIRNSILANINLHLNLIILLLSHPDLHQTDFHQ